jgi:hypothetical protein
MLRCLAHIFAFIALMTQIGLGSLPTGEASICIPVPSTAPPCCCDDEADCPATLDRSCPCPSGCDRCLRVPTHDGRATLTARAPIDFGHDWLLFATPCGTPMPIPSHAPMAIRAVPRATESPPHLSRMRTTLLTI